MIKIFKIERLNLLIQIFKGDISLENLYNLIEKVTTKNKYAGIKYLLMDIREAKLNISTKKLKDFVDWQKSNHKYAAESKYIFLSSNPKETAISEFYNKEFNGLFESKVYFELISALKHINLEDEIEEIKKYIK